MNDFTKATVFYAIALGLASVIALESHRLGETSPLITMLTPAAAVLVMMLIVTNDVRRAEEWRRLGLHRAGWSTWPLAIGLPVLLLTLSYGITWESGVGHLALPEAPFHASMLFRIALGLMIGFVFAMGEEVGWRGYLLAHLSTGRPLLQAMVVVGFLHGLWHMPLIFGTPYYHSAGSKLIVVPLFLATLTLAGILFGYLRVVSGSVWPVAAAHATWNMAWGILSELTTGSPVTLDYAAGESGVLPLAAVGIACLVLAPRIQRLTADGAPR